MYNIIKEYVFVSASLIGGYIITLLGGGDVPLLALMALILLDFISGFIVAFKTNNFNSTKLRNGLSKKIMILIMVGAAYHADLLFGNEGLVLRYAAIVGYGMSELSSLSKNSVLCGLPLIGTLKDFIEKNIDKHK